jgi:flagellin
MSVINTNVKSLITQAALVRNNRQLETAMHQLSTGKRINSAADDAAGLAITNKMTAQIKGLDQAVRNANDAIAMMQTAEGATIEITSMLQRMRELAVQAANGTNSENNTSALQLEFNELQQEIGRISKDTQWNGMNVLGDASGTYNMQIGANSGQVLAVTFRDIAAMTNVSAALDSAIDLTTSSTISLMDLAIQDIDNFRADMGAKINRLEYTTDNLINISINTSASRSRILDTDYAKAASELARTQIIQQAATAILSQANTEQQSVLKLLQG